MFQTEELNNLTSIVIKSEAVFGVVYSLRILASKRSVCVVGGGQPHSQQTPCAR